MSETIPPEAAPVEEKNMWGDEHEDFGHLHVPGNQRKPCLKCGKTHNHPYYLNLPERWTDCPLIQHITPASYVSSLPTQKERAKSREVEEIEKY